MGLLSTAIAAGTIAALSIVGQETADMMTDSCREIERAVDERATPTLCPPDAPQPDIAP